MTEDNSWVFDSLVCFLHGPIWNAPLQNFIEEKSLIFDPNPPIDESNPEYKKIHDDYKNLVDFMLGSFMDEMQITPEQFEIACHEGRNQQKSDGAFSFHQGLFQQIWAANDFRIFVRMMAQRNIELQLQALDLIERRQNSTSVDEDETKEHLKVENVAESINSNDEEIAQELENVVKSELKIAESQLNPLKKPYKALSLINDEILNKSQNDPSKDDRFDRLNLFFENQEISSDAIQSRQDYLRSQRDKILVIKKKARTKQLNESTKREQNSETTLRKNTRPTSAQAAQQALDGNVDDIKPKNSDAMQLRKTLAMRLRSEVVDKK